MIRYFGTDGVRGRANLEPLSPETVFKIGRAAAYIMLQKNKEVKTILGKDTRLSGDMLEAAFSAGICSSGGSVLNVGVMPTPGIAYLTKALNADIGVVISASHNPYEDNGIKIFSNNGLKLPDEKEIEIEQLLNGEIDNHRPTGKRIGRIINATGFEDKYLSFEPGRAVPDLRRVCESRFAHQGWNPPLEVVVQVLGGMQQARDPALGVARRPAEVEQVEGAPGP